MTDFDSTLTPRNIQDELALWTRKSQKQTHKCQQYGMGKGKSSFSSRHTSARKRLNQ